jgi:LacI family transcriptional regulator
VAGRSDSQRRAGGGTKRAVTMAAIAREAGVSIATVSKVLNGRRDVSPSTRAKVQDLLTGSGYRRRGSGLRHRVGLVDFVITELASPWACEILRGAEEEAHRRGMGLVVTTTHNRDAGARPWLDTLGSRRSDGVVLVVSRLSSAAADRLASMRTPFVLVDPVGGFDPSIPSVGATNFAGGLAATEHLLSLGHRRIGIVTGPPELLCSQERLDGYRAALRRADMPVDESLVRFGNFYADGGRDGARRLLDLADPPTAVFAGSDQQASGVYAEAYRRGLRIPADLSVVGFDDVDVCEWLWPRLTTVRQPLAEMARLATRTVLEGSEWLERSEGSGLDRTERMGGPERSGGLDRSEGSGLHRAGLERSGGAERSGLDRSGLDRSGLDRSGLERSGGAERSGTLDRLGGLERAPDRPLRVELATDLVPRDSTAPPSRPQSF